LFRIRWRSFAVFGPRIIFVSIGNTIISAHPIVVFLPVKSFGGSICMNVKPVFTLATECPSEKRRVQNTVPICLLMTNVTCVLLFLFPLLFLRVRGRGSRSSWSHYRCGRSLFYGSLFYGSLFDRSDDDLSLKVVNLKTQKDDRCGQETHKKREKIEHLQKNW
tara:strand:+ start:85 stop:573 length:489 start_codon:yes stop_codon:yes gene_type:complete